MNIDNSADDDPWLDEDLADPAIIAKNTSNEWERLSSKFTDAGYREGITAGQQSTLQAGFDQGYSTSGAPIGRDVGNLRGVAASLLTLLTSSSSSSSSSLSLDEAAKAQATEQVRDLVRRLGRLKLAEIAGRDEEAELHAIEHGEEIVVPQKVQEKRDLESLEQSMEFLGNAGKPENSQTSTNGKEELEACREQLRQILESLGLGKVQV